MIDREIKRKLKDCSFIVLQGKLLSALVDTGPKQMSFFFFFSKTTSTLQGQFKRISDSSEMPKEHAAASLQQSRTVICMFLQVKGMILKMESDLESLKD